MQISILDVEWLGDGGGGRRSSGRGGPVESFYSIYVQRQIEIFQGADRKN